MNADVEVRWLSEQMKTGVVIRIRDRARGGWAEIINLSVTDAVLIRQGLNELLG